VANVDHGSIGVATCEIREWSLFERLTVSALICIKCIPDNKTLTASNSGRGVPILASSSCVRAIFTEWSFGVGLFQRENWQMVEAIDVLDQIVDDTGDDEPCICDSGGRRL
jgi:hypothetical protein